MDQYVAQFDPEFMPIVKLNENEYEIKEIFTHRKGHAEEEERRIIKILHYPLARYVQRGIDRQLYAFKEDGYCNSHSCFWI